MIYKIVCIKNSMVYYGCTQKYELRIYAHFSNLLNGTHRNKRLQRDYNKYGKDAFICELIDSSPKNKRQLKTEKALIKQHAYRETYNIEHSNIPYKYYRKRGYNNGKGECILGA